MACLIVDEPENGTEEEGDKEEIWNIEALCGAYSSCNELCVDLLETTDRLSICEYKTDTIDDGLGTKSCDEWRNLKLGDDEAVDETDDDSYSDDNEEYKPHVHFRNSLPKSSCVITSMYQDTCQTGCKTEY